MVALLWLSSQTLFIDSGIYEFVHTEKCLVAQMLFYQCMHDTACLFCCLPQVKLVCHLLNQPWTKWHNELKR